MSSDLIWPVLCLAIGLILLIAEVFVPSGGLLGLSAALFLGASLWLAFSRSTATGLKLLASIAVLVPMAMLLAMYLWPRTPMGRWLSLSPPGPEDIEAAPISQGTRLEYLIGQYGRSLTPLRPSGTVELDGRRIDGIAEEGMIPSGVIVRAVQVRGGQVVVRIATAEALGGLLSESESS